MQTKIKKDYTLYKILIWLLLGSILGAVFANTMNQVCNDKISLLVENFFSDSVNSFCTNKADLFTDEFFKHGKIIFFIWLMSFLPLGRIFIPLILFFKGISYGFSSSVLFSVYKLSAVTKIGGYILCHDIFFFAANIFISIYSFRYISLSKHNKNLQNTFEHIFVFVMSMLYTFLILLVQVYIKWER